MSPDQMLVFIIGMVLVALGIMEFWRPQLRSVL